MKYCDDWNPGDSLSLSPMKVDDKNNPMEQNTDHEKPPRLYSNLEDLGSIIRIIIPVKKRLVSLTIVPIWTGIWIFGIIMAKNKLIHRGGLDFFGRFDLLWIAGSIIAIGLGTFTFLWNLIGKEIITVDIMKLIIVRKVGSLKIQKSYSLEHCKNFRINTVKVRGSSAQGQMESLGFGPGRIAFDYGMKTVKCASNVGEDEAAYLINLLRNRGFIKKR